MKKVEKGICYKCKRQFPLNDLLVTGYVDDKGKEELVCKECDNPKAENLLVSDGLS